MQIAPSVSSPFVFHVHNSRLQLYPAANPQAVFFFCVPMLKKLNPYFSLKGPQRLVTLIGGGGLAGHRMVRTGLMSESEANEMWGLIQHWAGTLGKSELVRGILRTLQMACLIVIHSEIFRGEICQFKLSACTRNTPFISPWKYIRGAEMKRHIWSFMMPAPAGASPAGHDVQPLVLDAAIPSS